MSQPFTIRLFAWSGAATFLLASAGVAQAQNAAPEGPAVAAVPASAPAIGQEPSKAVADAAWAVLQALRDYVHAAQILDNPQQRDEALAKAKKALTGLVGLRPGGDPESLPTYVSFWPPVVARYVDGFQRDKLQVVPGSQQLQVIAVAANPEDQRVHDQLFQEITKRLQDQGYTGQNLASRRHIDVTRELAQKGIGYPIHATIVLTMRRFNGQWKATELDLQPPLVPAAGSQPARAPAPLAPAVPDTTGKSSTQPAQ